MFQNLPATHLDVSNFNTSNVIDMGGMFFGTKATVLDLSNLDVQKATVVEDMFRNAKATTGYARTQSDAVKMNNSSYKPSNLIFTVK